jgi:hypothetical protein
MSSSSPASCPASKVLNPAFRHCSGSTYVPYQPGHWFRPAGEFAVSSDDTRCAFCVHTMGLKDEYKCEPYERDDGGIRINCDTHQDKRLTSIETNQFEIKVTYKAKHRGGKHEPLLRKLDKSDPDGFGVFLVPTQTEYRVEIINKVPGTLFQIIDPQVGSKKVKLYKGNGDVYSEESATIEGFEPGTKSSFVFYSPSEYEKQTETTSDKAEDRNVSNVIRFSLRRSKRTPRPMHSQSFNHWGAPSRVLEDICHKYYGAPPANPTRAFNFGSHTYGSGTGSIPPPSSFGYGGFGEARSELSGGSTLFGSSVVKEKPVEHLSDPVSIVGEDSKITIQLACFQDDETKRNDNLRLKLYEAGWDHALAAREKADARLTEFKHKHNALFMQTPEESWHVINEKTLPVHVETDAHEQALTKFRV